MNPLVVLSAVVAAASGAPSNYAAAPVAAAAHGYAAVAPAAPVALPAPYSTQHVSGAPVTTIHQAPAVQTKQVHLGATTYVSGHVSEIIKPPTPVLPISVPTVLKGTQSVGAPIVKKIDEIHTAVQPVPVERKVPVPYDVPVLREQIVKVPVAVPVKKPYAVPVPTPVQGEPIVNVHQTAPVVHREHTNIVAQPAVAAVGYAAAPVAAHGYAAAGYAAAPALAHGYAAQGYAAQGYATQGYAAAPVAAVAAQY